MNECIHILRAQGKAYPRTCMLCGLGPCKKSGAEAVAINAHQGITQAPAFISPPAEPDDPLTAKRKREAFINAAFTREQQQAIGMILERWWGQKMAGIETGKVIEATEKIPQQIAELREELRKLTGL